MAATNRITPGGIANTIETSQGEVTTATAIEIAPGRSLRTRLHIKNTSTDTDDILFVGVNDSVTSSTGYSINAGEELKLETSAAIYAIATNATITVHVLDEYYDSGVSVVG